MATAAHIIAAVLIVTLCCFSGGGQVSAQQTPPAPKPAADRSSSAVAPDCMTNLLNMSDCLSYVQVGSNETVPHKACCPELTGLVESSPKCLCYLLGGGTTKQLGIKLDMKKAMDLPSVCGVSTPPPGLCSVLGVPVGAPSGSGGPQSPGSHPLEGKNGNGALGTEGSPMASVYLLLLASAMLLRLF